MQAEEAEPRPAVAPAGEGRWTVRRVVGVEARDGRLALTLETEAGVAGAGNGAGDGSGSTSPCRSCSSCCTRSRGPARDSQIGSAAANAAPALPRRRDPPARGDGARARPPSRPARRGAAPLRLRLAGGMARPLLDRLRRAAE